MSKARFYYQVALSQSQEQHRRSAGFDGRAVALTAVSATLAGVGAVMLKDFLAGPAPIPAVALTALLAAALLGAVLFAISGLRPRGWAVNPDPADLAGHLRSHGEEELAEWVGDEITQAVTHNEHVLVLKGKAVRRASWCLAAMAVLVIALAVAVNLGPPAG